MSSRYVKPEIVGARDNILHLSLHATITFSLANEENAMLKPFEAEDGLYRRLFYFCFVLVLLFTPNTYHSSQTIQGFQHTRKSNTLKG
jgi:hypothetical protein